MNSHEMSTTLSNQETIHQILKIIKLFLILELIQVEMRILVVIAWFSIHSKLKWFFYVLKSRY
jgi:hypothetical protein